MLIRPFIGGLATYLPILSRASMRRTGGTDSAAYCYSVWLRHLVMAARNGLSTMPETVAELGPGDSLGIGLAALLSGARNYYALDAVKYADIKRNLLVFDELVELFRKRVPIPDESQFPALKPYLESYEFPGHILTKERLRSALQQTRLDAIKAALAALGRDRVYHQQIAYFAPWDDPALLQQNSVDMIYSQAVLEHVDDLERTYRMLSRWLKSDGFMSHQVDFKSHGSAVEWNGHWTYSDFAWTVIRGKRPYLLNRQPHSVHLNLLTKNGLQIVCDQRHTTTSGVTRQQLARRFQHLSDEDLKTSSAFVQAVKTVCPGSTS
ncbi:MAG: hypothetical protein OJF52_001962 [Nitrospira sp.]|nr:MAG: hypothetical protein OJF52_001962 [Nitrospira sp.]